MTLQSNHGWFCDVTFCDGGCRLSVGQKLMENGFTTFRDAEELDQATRFLHENGLLGWLLSLHNLFTG